MPIDTVVARIDPAADKPFPERCVTGVESPFPILVPIEKIGILLEAFRNIIQTEPLIDSFICHVCLRDELGRRVIIPFLLPMHRDLRFSYVNRLVLCHCQFSLTTVGGSSSGDRSFSPRKVSSSALSAASLFYFMLRPFVSQYRYSASRKARRGNTTLSIFGTLLHCSSRCRRHLGAGNPDRRLHRDKFVPIPGR